MSKSVDAFLRFQAQLLSKVEHRSDVLGLVFLGSSAATDRVDEHSDHDFFLIVQKGVGEAYRKNLDWLPNHTEILLAPRETAHGLKVIYKDLRLLEFAVFEDDELELSSANDYAVALDKSNISARMAAIAKRSVPRQIDPLAEFELFLALIQIGLGRFRRGEVLASEQHLKSYAVEKLIKLIRHYKPAAHSHADSLNAFRRFERDYPNLAADISALQLLPGDQCASGLLDLGASLPLSPDEINKLTALRKGLGI